MLMPHVCLSDGEMDGEGGSGREVSVSQSSQGSRSVEDSKGGLDPELATVTPTTPGSAASTEWVQQQPNQKSALGVPLLSTRCQSKTV